MTCFQMSGSILEMLLFALPMFMVGNPDGIFLGWDRIHRVLVMVQNMLRLPMND